MVLDVLDDDLAQFANVLEQIGGVASGFSGKDGGNTGDGG